MLTSSNLLGSLPLEEFLKGLRAWSKGINADPGQQSFGKLKRKADGTFENAELVALIQDYGRCRR